MADQLSPEERGRRFSVALRGYQRAQVDRFVEEVIGRLQSLEAERGELAGRLRELGARTSDELLDEFQVVSQQVGEVLRQAWEAAEGMRDRATAEAGQWRAEAEAEVSALRRQAQSEAEALRREAWETAEELVRRTQAEAARLLEQGEQDSLTIRANAEREAHRLVANSRREAEDELRSARMEGERLLVEARAQHDDILEKAHREAQGAQERARALESRRRELMDELETRREALRATEMAESYSAVRVLGSEEEGSEWTAGEESVRIVPAPARQEPVDADSMAAEVRRLRTVHQVPAPPPEPVEVEAPTEQQADAQSTQAAVAEAVEDELQALFAVLRDEEQAPPPAPPPAQPVPEAPQPPPPPVVPPEPVSDLDPFDLRDRLLLPVQNRVLRSIKRQLTEEQNVVLEDLRVRDGDWEPDAGPLEERLHGDLVILAQESFAAGHAAAGEMSGRSVGRPRPEDADLPDPTQRLAADLVGNLEQALVEGRRTGQGSRELSATVSRVFRGWRTDESERRVRAASLSAYHRGLARALGPGPLALRWQVSGRGCADCRAAAEAGAIGAEEALRGEAQLPPAHPGCACTLVPARS
ncbi:MAG: DivIVA domain-containing protein [Actinomycetota bacterium]|nr:DivIVA domain-containing protein [Actinomycetota bacterium]